MTPNPEKPASFATLLKLYLRGLIDLAALITPLLENLVELAERQEAHSVLIEMTAEAYSELDQDIELLARYLHLTRPSRSKRAGDDLNPDQNGATGTDSPDLP